MKYLGFLSFLSDCDVKCGLVLMKWCPYVEASVHVKGKEMEEIYSLEIIMKHTVDEETTNSRRQFQILLLFQK